MNNKIENKSKILTYTMMAYFLVSPLDYVLPHFGNATILTVVGLIVSAYATFLVFGHNSAKITGDQACILLLALFMVASNLWALDTARSYSYTFSFVATAAMYFMLLFFRFSKRETELFEMAFIIGGACFVLYVFTKVDLSLIMAGYRLDFDNISDDAYFSDPNGMAARLMMPLIFLVKRIFGNDDKRLKILYAALMCLIIYMIFLTGSRAAVLALMAVTFVLVWSLGGKHANKLVLFLIILIIIVILFPNLLPEHIVERIFNFEKYQEVTTLEGDRLDIWKNVIINIFPLSPVWGYGAGNSSLAMVECYGREKAVHNSWLAVLVDLGFVGFVLWMTIIAGKLRQAISMRKKNVYVLAVLIGILFMATTLDAAKEKYLWNGLLYVHMMYMIYLQEENGSDLNKQ